MSFEEENWRKEIRDFVIARVISEARNVAASGKEDNLGKISLSAWTLTQEQAPTVHFSWPEGESMHLMFSHLCCTEPPYHFPGTTSVEAERKLSADGWCQARKLVDRFRLEYAAQQDELWRFAVSFSTTVRAAGTLRDKDICLLKETLLSKVDELRRKASVEQMAFYTAHFGKVSK